MRLYEFLERVKSGEIDILEHINKVLDYSEKHDEYFNTLTRDLAVEQAEDLQKSNARNDGRRK